MKVSWLIILGVLMNLLSYGQEIEQRIIDIANEELKALEQPFLLKPSGYATSGDLNNDGITDWAVIADTYEEGEKQVDEARYLVIVFKGKQGWNLILNEPCVRCEACGGMMGEPISDISIEEGNFIISYFGGSGWKWNAEYRLTYNEDLFERPFDLSKEQESYFRGAYANLEKNYYRGTGKRSFGLVIDPEEGEEMEDVETEFVLIPINKVGSVATDSLVYQNISGNQWITYGAKRWENNQDLSYDVNVTFEEEALHFKVKVLDEDIVPSMSSEDLLKSDHLELWLDFNESVYEDYYEESFRVKLNNKMIQLAIGFNQDNTPKVELYYPELKNPAPIEVQITGQREGYTMEFVLTSDWLEKYIMLSDIFFSAKDLSYKENYDEYFKSLGMTIVISDTDDISNRKQDTLMATSKLKWGNPLTFGRVDLYKEFKQPTVEQLIEDQ